MSRANVCNGRAPKPNSDVNTYTIRHSFVSHATLIKRIRVCRRTTFGQLRKQLSANQAYEYPDWMKILQPAVQARLLS